MGGNLPHQPPIACAQLPPAPVDPVAVDLSRHTVLPAPPAEAAEFCQRLDTFFFSEAELEKIIMYAPKISSPLVKPSAGLVDEPVRVRLPGQVRHFLCVK